MNFSRLRTVTGPKTDLWLVKTVGIVLANIGATLLFVQFNAQVNPPGIFLAIASALSATSYPNR